MYVITVYVLRFSLHYYDFLLLKCIVKEIL